MKYSYGKDSKTGEQKSKRLEKVQSSGFRKLLELYPRGSGVGPTRKHQLQLDFFDMTDAVLCISYLPHITDS